MEITKVEFTVDAGKYLPWEDQIERNYKYCDTFDTFAEAKAAADTCKDYDFVDFEMRQYWNEGAEKFCLAICMFTGAQQKAQLINSVWTHI